MTGAAGQSGRCVAIVGAGMSGVACAMTLGVQLEEVTLFEAASTAGGRMAVARQGGFEFDAGAQYFTARDEMFRGYVDTWQTENLVRPWSGWFVDLDAGGMLSREAEERFVAVPNMAALVRSLARLCNTRFDCPVHRMHRDGEGWALLSDEDRALGRFDAVVLAMPPSATARLLRDVQSPLVEDLRQVEMTACRVLMLGFDEPLGVPFDAAFVSGSPIAWIARNQSKPGRADREAWVVHACPEWSEAQREAPEEDVSDRLLRAFQDVTGVNVPRPRLALDRCWPEAAPLRPTGSGSLFDSGMALGACGDWCLGPRIEAAFSSGLLMAERVLEWAEGPH